MEGPGPSKAAVDRLRERKESAERTFDTVVSRMTPTWRLWREWKEAATPAAKAAAYARLRPVVLAHPSLGALAIVRENAIEDFEAAVEAERRTGT